MGDVKPLATVSRPSRPPRSPRCSAGTASFAWARRAALQFFRLCVGRDAPMVDGDVPKGGPERRGELRFRQCLREPGPVAPQPSQPRRGC